MNKKLLSFFLFFMSFSAIAEKDMVWKISKGDNSFYVIGANRLQSEGDQLSSTLMKVYNDSSVIVFFFVYKGLQKDRVRMLKNLKYNGLSSLKYNINKKTYKRLSSFLLREGVDLNDFSDFKPQLVRLLSRELTLKNLGAENKFNTSVTLYKKSIKDKKETLALESSSEQFDLIYNSGTRDESKFINATINSLNRLKDNFYVVRRLLNRGDIKGLDSLLLLPVKQESPVLYENFLVDRNIEFTNKINKMLNDNKKALVVLGFMQLLGSEGVLELLVNSGFKVTQLNK